MARGDGSVSEVKRRDGRSYRPKHWRIKIPLGSDPVTGKRRTPLSRTVKGTKTEALKVRDQMRAELQAGYNGGDDSATFESFADQWFLGRKASGKLSKTRLARVKGIVKLLKSYLGNVKLGDITPLVVDSTIEKIREDKTKALGRYSNTTLNMVFKVLRQILEKAVDYGLIANNPTSKAEVPQPEATMRKSLSSNQVLDLIHLLDGKEAEAIELMVSARDRQTQGPHEGQTITLPGMRQISYLIASRIGLATGMRRGEVLGLVWNSVDLDEGLICVRQSINVYGELKEPKTRAGCRILAIDDKTREHLNIWHERQGEELRFLGLAQDPSTPVCCSNKGHFINPNHFSNWWRYFVNENEFPGLKFHELRHTQASQLIAHGTDLKEVQYRLGHSSFSLTMDLYAHALPANDRRAAETIGSLFVEPVIIADGSPVFRLVS